MPIEIPTDAKRRAWADAVASMPEAIRAVASRFDPWGRYTLDTTGQVVRIDSFGADGTLLIWIDDELNSLDDPRTGCQVFGIDPDDLTPWKQPLDG